MLAGLPCGAQEELALRLVDELLREGTPTRDLVLDAERGLGRAQLIELLLVAGYYAMLGGVVRAVQLDLDNVLEKVMLGGGRLSGGDINRRAVPSARSPAASAPAA